MRQRLRSNLALSVGLASLLALLVAATPAGAREFSLGGHSTTPGCQGHARVRFDVTFDQGNYKKVSQFQAKDFNYPNKTASGTPIPVGTPRGQCVPGETGWITWFNRGPQGLSADIPFGTGNLPENQFLGEYKTPATGTTIEQWEVYGQVHVDKVVHRRCHRRHHRRHCSHIVSWNVSAEGYFIRAVSEGGLIYGGSSTGEVDWKAHN